MAQTNKRKTSSRKTSTRASAKHKKPTHKRLTLKEERKRKEMRIEIALLSVVAISLILILGNLGFSAMVISGLAYVFFGFFGVMEYIFPFVIFVLTWFLLANLGNNKINKRMVASGAIFTILDAFCQLVYGYKDSYTIVFYFKNSASGRCGGGLLGGIVVKVFGKLFGVAGTYILLFFGLLICICIISGKTVMLALAQEVKELAISFGQKIKGDEGEELIPQVPKKTRKKKKLDTELVLGFDEEREAKVRQNDDKDLKDSFMQSLRNKKDSFLNSEKKVGSSEELDGQPPFILDKETEKIIDNQDKKMTAAERNEETKKVASQLTTDKPLFLNYKLPDISILQKGKGSNISEDDARENAFKLQQTLNSFGVKAKVVAYTKGPSVTQFEIQPEIGVKVKKISDLADDIKLSLAVPDVRIEAPIPGKSVVGIEIPNKQSSSVYLRDLLESEEFKKAKSKISFAVGKDITGKVVISDIAKLPHLLIGGSTGSGKSVFMNTLIMSILYKASPDEVKFFMIDPKMIELSVYNKIPHLFVPVVTDPKKAAGVLNYAVVEMTKRYKLFKEFNVKNLEEYNKKVVNLPKSEDGRAFIKDDKEYVKKPQIVIVVDEFADLMMVAKGEVEESVVRLAQLARAAGIHLILATQRPSVDVITGLIKANMPSRCALLVSSGVDSRTILDQVGAEKLLGNGDMLYSPSGTNVPLRIQGSFISGSEVEKVVEDIVKKNGEHKPDEKIEEEIKSSNSLIGGEVGISSNSNDESDEYLKEAGILIIEKQKASVGMLQRQFRIGFNRAARIMNTLHCLGVVSEEEGTKPRKVLMTSVEEFERRLKED